MNWLPNATDFKTIKARIENVAIGKRKVEEDLIAAQEERENYEKNIKTYQEELELLNKSMPLCSIF